MFIRCVMEVWPRRPAVEVRIREASAKASSASRFEEPSPGRRVFLCFFFCA